MDESSVPDEPKLQIPRYLDYRDWRCFAIRVWNGIWTDNISLVAAGCAFYALLAMPDRGPAAAQSTQPSCGASDPAK